jgi:FAD synthase
LLPGDGVFAGSATLPTGEQFLAAINISTRPTVHALTGSHERRLEAHLLRGESEGAAWSELPGVREYDWPIRLCFHAFVRESMKFAGLDALRAQIARDVARVPLLVELAQGGVA